MRAQHHRIVHRPEPTKAEQRQSRMCNAMMARPVRTLTVGPWTISLWQWGTGPVTWCAELIPPGEHLARLADINTGEAPDLARAEAAALRVCQTQAAML